ncbi:hypothetical protein ACFOLD_00510 [Kocuria carniphila]
MDLLVGGSLSWACGPWLVIHGLLIAFSGRRAEPTPELHSGR